MLVAMTVWGTGVLRNADDALYTANHASGDSANDRSCNANDRSCNAADRSGRSVADIGALGSTTRHALSARCQR